MEKYLKNRKIIIAFVVLLLIMIIGSVLIRNRTELSPETKQDFLVKVNQDGKELTIDSNNTVTFKTQNGKVYTENWEEDKVNEFLLYLQYQDTKLDGATTVTYGNGESTTINGSEILDLVEDDVVGGGGDSNSTPTPAPTTGSGGGSNSTPTPAPWQRPPGCTYWRLNYCADRPATPTPIASPVSGEVPYEFNCELEDRMVSTRTIISNTLCISTPTPSPTP